MPCHDALMPTPKPVTARPMARALTATGRRTSNTQDIDAGAHLGREEGSRGAVRTRTDRRKSPESHPRR